MKEPSCYINGQKCMNSKTQVCFKVHFKEDLLCFFTFSTFFYCVCCCLSMKKVYSCKTQSLMGVIHYISKKCTVLNSLKCLNLVLSFLPEIFPMHTQNKGCCHHETLDLSQYHTCSLGHLRVHSRDRN